MEVKEGLYGLTTSTSLGSQKITAMFRWWQAIFDLIFWLPDKYVEVWTIKSKRKLNVW